MAEEEKEYEILNENFPDSDFFFKIIVIGNSGKKILFIISI